LPDILGSTRIRNSPEVREARLCLSPRENRVIELLYDFGWQSREIAAELRVNESRVSQIKQRAISKASSPFGIGNRTEDRMMRAFFLFSNSDLRACWQT
jgi:DNA-directed RNA polymerase specialized sigma24 family protein